MKRKGLEIPYLLAVFPLIILISLLSVNVYLYGDEAISGSNQLSLILSGSIAGVIGLLYGSNWKEILNGISNSIKSVTPAIIILLLIGALAGTWLLSGIIPAMIYYGLEILSPKIFLFATCLICAIVSLSTGSSWSTVATIGISLLAVGQALDLSLGIIAGAIISGSYFGDKMSPLSDTTNLAPAMADTDLFTHIRYMMYTTIPSFVITLIIFLFIGFNYSNNISTNEISEILLVISNKFSITPWLFVVPVIVIYLIIKKIPAIPSLLVGTILGGVFAIIFQPGIMQDLSNKENNLFSNYKIIINSMTLETNFKETNNKINNIDMIEYRNTANIKDSIIGSDTIPKCFSTNEWNELTIYDKNNWKNGNSIKIKYVNALNFQSEEHPARKEAEKRGDLLKSKGMSGMMNTIWLVICAMIFGGCMESTGLLNRISSPIIEYAKSNGSLVATTAGTCIFFNITVSDQYLSIIIPGKMFKERYKDIGIHQVNLSRTLEDSGTVTSVLVPWNTCGAYHQGVLGVSTLTYLPYCFFNLISPLMTITYAYLGIKIKQLVR